jgi:hypothetical protein
MRRGNCPGDSDRWTIAHLVSMPLEFCHWEELLRLALRVLYHLVYYSYHNWGAYLFSWWKNEDEKY